MNDASITMKVSGGATPLTFVREHYKEPLGFEKDGFLKSFLEQSLQWDYNLRPTADELL